MNKQHFELCAESSYQIEALCIALKSAARSNDPDVVESLRHLVQASVQRISDLSAAWVLSLDGMDDDLSDFHFAIYGRKPECEVCHGL